MKKVKSKKKLEKANAKLFIGKQMLHNGRRCTVGFIDGSYAFISYNGEAEAMTVLQDDLYELRET